MSDSQSEGNASSATPDLKDLKGYMDANRVYEELGSKRACQALIDKAPKLIYEDELVLRLHKRDGKLKQCKVYIFNDYFLVGSQRLRKRKPEGSKIGEESTGMTTASSSDSGVVWFGSNKASEESSTSSKETPNEPALDYDSDISYVDFVKDIAKIEERKEKKEKRLYNLKMWVDLGKVKPNYQRVDDMHGISIVYVSKVQEEIAPGEFRYNTVVDQAEIWTDNESKAKTICGLIQDAVNKKAMEALIEISKQRKAEERQRQMSLRTEGSAGDTDTDQSIPSVEDLGRSNSQLGVKGKLSTKSGSTSSSGRRKRAKEKLRRGKQALAATVAMGAMTEDQRKKAPQVALTYKDIQKKYTLFTQNFTSEEKGAAKVDEGLAAEFVVNFKNSKLGLALSSSKRIGPFVTKTVKHGLAEASGVVLGDIVVAINDTEITLNHTWRDVVQIIALEKEKQQDMMITFRRKQKNELGRVRKEEAQIKAFEERQELKKEEEAAQAAEEVLPIEDTPVIGETKTMRNRKHESLELRRKTEDGSNIPKYTLKRKKTGKRKWAQKRRILEDMKNLNVGRKEFKEFRKHKKRMFELFQEIRDLFETVKHHAKSKEEMTCIYALQEIYDTEYKYHANLNRLKGINMALLTAQKNVMCKQLKSSKPFCEHRRPRRYCKQESSIREEAIDHKLVNSIFLNLKPIIKSNQYLWKNLQTKLGELYKQAALGTKVEVHEMLEVFCDVFIEIAPFLALYWNYCRRYTGACEKQRILRTENHFFYEIIRPTEKKMKMRLPNLLAKPVQRVTRYHLLFDTLRKHALKYTTQQENAGMSKKHLDMLEASTSKLGQACVILKELATKVNDKVGEAAKLDEILPVFNEIGGKGDDKISNLIAPHRRFDSKHEVGYEHPRLDIAQDKALMYLFNDKLAFAVVRDMTTVKKGSKYSYMRRGLLGNSRATSFSKTKKKISMGTVVSEKEAIEAKKKLSLPKEKKKSGIPKKKSLKEKGTGTLSKKLSLNALRLSNERLKTKTNRLSLGSKDSKGSERDMFYYEVLFHFPMREIGVISDRNKTKDDVTLYGVDIYYSKKHEKGSDTTFLTVWVEEKEMREKLKALINSLVREDKAKRAELRRIRDKKLGKKRKKWAKKHDAYKKGSIPIVPGGRAKSSMHSKA